MRYTAYIAFALVSLATGGTPALAQQGNHSPSTSNMSQGMDGHGQSGMDMHAMANQCAQMRRQMQQNPSASVSDDMRKMMTQCDQMDKMMGRQQSGSGMGQTK
ncbi:MAG TPA: hypothetical protein VKZ79_23015 [Alphaproteobacteria bacterium]|nr:hypothetical protein [Alphaproteobacteria bacterium]